MTGQTIVTRMRHVDPFGSLGELTAAIEAAGRTLYTAHVPLLTR